MPFEPVIENELKVKCISRADRGENGGEIIMLGLQVVFLFTQCMAQTMPRQPVNQIYQGGFKSIVPVMLFLASILPIILNNWRINHSLTPNSTYMDLHDIKNHYHITRLQSLSTTWRILRPMLCIMIYKYLIIINHDFNKLCLCFRRKL